MGVGGPSRYVNEKIDWGLGFSSGTKDQDYWTKYKVPCPVGSGALWGRNTLESVTGRGLPTSGSRTFPSPVPARVVIGGRREQSPVHVPRPEGRGSDRRHAGTLPPPRRPQGRASVRGRAPEDGRPVQPPLRQSI